MRVQSIHPPYDLEPPLRILSESHAADLQPGTLRVWTAALPEIPDASADDSPEKVGGPESGFNTAFSVLSEEERETLSRFRNVKAARLYGAAHAMTRRALHAARPVFGITDHLPRTAKGKPYLPKPADGLPLYFSLSHAWPMAAVAITEAGECGVDVEMRDAGTRWREFASDVLHPDDLTEILASQDPQSAFIRCWTRKEAAAKAAGLGLHWNFAGFRVCPRTGVARPDDDKCPIVVRTVHCRLLHPLLDGWLSVACRTPGGIMPPVLIHPFAQAEHGVPPYPRHEQPKENPCPS